MGGEGLLVLCINEAVRTVLSDAVCAEEMAAGEAEEVVWLGVGVRGADGDSALQRGPGFHTDIATSNHTKSLYFAFPATNSIYSSGNSQKKRSNDFVSKINESSKPAE